jgi:hypothetical protein
MKEFHRMTLLAALGLLIFGFAGNMFAQDPDRKGQQDRVKNDTTMTGCLTKGSAGNYTLTDEQTGVKTTVTGPAELEKHSTNHKVTLTGTAKTDSNGNQVFEVSKIQHVSPSCKAPSQ